MARRLLAILVYVIALDVVQALPPPSYTEPLPHYVTPAHHDSAISDQEDADA